FQYHRLTALLNRAVLWYNNIPRGYSMKRFRFATIHLVMIGFILFSILAICIRLAHTQTPILLASFLVVLSLVALLYYQKESYEFSELRSEERRVGKRCW